MIVSHVPPSLTSSSLALRPPTPMPFRSSLRMSLRIFPPGVWIASFAGFLLPAPDPLAVLGLDPLALEAAMLIADPGRANGMGLAPPGFDEGVITEPSPPATELGC